MAALVDFRFVLDLLNPLDVSSKPLRFLQPNVLRWFVAHRARRHLATAHAKTVFELVRCSPAGRHVFGEAARQWRSHLWDHDTQVFEDLRSTLGHSRKNPILLIGAHLSMEFCT